MTVSAQPGILAPVPAVARYLTFTLSGPVAAPALRQTLARFSASVDGDRVVVGVGAALAAAAGARLDTLGEFPALEGGGATGGQLVVPSTPGALWCWLRGADVGELVVQTQQLQQALAPAFLLGAAVDAFRHRLGASGHGRDLTGYEDGTENPEGEAALQAALVQGQGAGQDGASYVAVQQWQHDFAAFEAMTQDARDHTIGRRLSDNEELDDAPPTAHVKRTAQEDYDPPAFMLRRSMPWVAGTQAGLMFVAFGHSHAAFEAQMRRMAGLDDGLCDALFAISRPVTGAYYWCPPIVDGRLDLRQLGV